jgi:hypothetical protein
LKSILVKEKLSVVANILLLLIISVQSLAGNEMPPGQSFIRCSFSNGTHLVRYHFVIDKDFGTNCSYGVEANGKFVYNSKAFAKDCQSYIKYTLTRGEVCLGTDF